MSPLRHALGIDIGGTKIAIGVVAADGRVLASRRVATESHRGPPEATRRIAQAVRQTLQECGLEIRNMAGVGVGCAGPVDPALGTVNNPHTLPGWENWNIVDSLQCALDQPVWLENDADAAALGEYYYGAGQGIDTLAMLTFGTGVGGAVIVGGSIYRGTGGGHPEIGHLPVASGGVTCYCGRPGCLESIASGPAIASAGTNCGFADAAQVFAAAAAGQAAADRILTGVRDAIATAIWTLLHTHWPARIILGGGLVDAHPEFFLTAARAPIPHASLMAGAAVEIARASLGNQAGLIGAARWASERSSAAVQSRPGTCLPLPLPSP